MAKNPKNHAKKHERKRLTLNFLLHSIKDVPEIRRKRNQKAHRSFKINKVKKFKEI